METEITKLAVPALVMPRGFTLVSCDIFTDGGLCALLQETTTGHYVSCHYVNHEVRLHVVQNKMRTNKLSHKQRNAGNAYMKALLRELPPEWHQLHKELYAD